MVERLDAREGAGERGGVGQVAGDHLDRKPLEVVAPAFGAREAAHGTPVRQQRPHDVRADEAGSASN